MNLPLTKLDAIWVCLAASPLLVLTLVAYLAAINIYARAKHTICSRIPC